MSAMGDSVLQQGVHFRHKVPGVDEFVYAKGRPIHDHFPLGAPAP